MIENSTPRSRFDCALKAETRCRSSHRAPSLGKRSGRFRFPFSFKERGLRGEFRIFLSLTILVSACNPSVEKIYEHSFELRAARELDAIGDTAGARYYLSRALLDAAARTEAYNFLHKMAERKEKAGECIDQKKTDLAINQYPRIRHKHLFQLAVCFEASGDTARALNSYNLSENAGSKQPQLYLRRALLEERRGGKTLAQKDLLRAVELNAEYPPAQLSYALFLIRSGESVGLGKITGMLQQRKPLYAEIIADAEKHREAMVKAIASQVESDARK